MTALSFYEKIDHTADMGIRVTGATLADLFIHAGLAMFDLIATVEEPPAETWISVAVSGSDEVDLLINWLRELLYLFNGEGLVVRAVVIDSLQPSRLTARVGVTAFDPEKNEIINDIKAVTYHQARIETSEKEYAAFVIFDL